MQKWQCSSLVSSPPAAAMSHLEQLIVSMVDVFEEYAGQEGKKNQISMDELKTLIDNEVSKPEFQVRGYKHPLKQKTQPQYCKYTHNINRSIQNFSFS